MVTDNTSITTVNDSGSEGYSGGETKKVATYNLFTPSSIEYIDHIGFDGTFETVNQGSFNFNLYFAKVYSNNRDADRSAFFSSFREGNTETVTYRDKYSNYGDYVHPDVVSSVELVLIVSERLGDSSTAEWNLDADILVERRSTEEV